MLSLLSCNVDTDRFFDVCAEERLRAPGTRPGRLAWTYSHGTQRLRQREHAGFFLSHLTLESEQARHVLRSFGSGRLIVVIEVVVVVVVKKGYNKD